MYNIIKITHFIYTFSLPPPSKDFKYLSHCHWSHSQENHMPLFVLVTLKTTQKINKTKLQYNNYSHLYIKLPPKRENPRGSVILICLNLTLHCFMHPCSRNHAIKRHVSLQQKRHFNLLEGITKNKINVNSTISSVISRSFFNS